MKHPALRQLLNSHLMHIRRQVSKGLCRLLDPLALSRGFDRRAPQCFYMPCKIVPSLLETIPVEVGTAIVLFYIPATVQVNIT